MVKPKALYRLNVIDSFLKRRPRPKESEQNRIQIQLIRPLSVPTGNAILDLLSVRFQADFPAISLFPLLDAKSPLFEFLRTRAETIRRDFYIIFPCIDATASLWQTREYEPGVVPTWGIVTPRNKIYCLLGYNRKTVHRLIWETVHFQCMLCEQWTQTDICVACSECGSLYCEVCEEEHIGECARNLSCVVERRKLPQTLVVPCPGQDKGCTSVKHIDFRWKILNTELNEKKTAARK